MSASTQTYNREDTCLVIRPNASLSWRQARIFLLLLCGVSFAISISLALRGYWLVLPYSGLEVGAVAVALYWSLRAGLYREVITFEGETVRLETGMDEPKRRLEFNRSWLGVRLEPGGGRLRDRRLLLSSGGVQCEVGMCLTDEEREELGRRLRALVGPEPRFAPASGVSAEV